MELSSEILSNITVYTKYSKYNDSIERREIWNEIVDRNKNMHIKKYPKLKGEIEDAYKFVYDRKVLPSMRSLQFAGKPIQISPNRIYNCAYAPIDDWRVFGEIMFLLLGGTGVGYSVQYHHIEKLPEIRLPNSEKRKRFLVGDSIEGWADAVKALIKSYFYGTSTLDFDFSDVRPKGALLVTSGGKAPGPDPLKHCVEQIRKLLSSKKNGTKLKPVEVHDIICYIADAVLAGGIRRAALIALFSATDEDMFLCKSNFKITKWNHLYSDGPVNSLGETQKVIQQHVDHSGKTYYDINVLVEEPHYGLVEKTAWWVDEKDFDLLKKKNILPWYYFEPQRGRANNSVALVRHKVTKKKFDQIWETVKNSGCGEPGIYFTNDKDWGTNPCCEIALRPFQFCNLCEINVSNIESQDDLNERVKAATLIGTLQAGYTDFHYLREIWKKTTEKDALLGLGTTGIGSGVILKYDMKQAAAIAVSENERIASIIKIKSAARITTIKPSGTSSLVLGCSSGIHAWHSEYYIRRMRIGKNEAIYTYLSINHPELLEDEFFSPATISVISIPQKAPKDAILRHESSIDLLNRVKYFYDNWIVPGHRDGSNTHNISATISVKDNEWDDVAAWMWLNKNSFNGLSVLPFNDHNYKQSPFEECTKEHYNKMMKSLTEVDLSKVVELVDNTNQRGELACGSGGCEII